MQKIRIAGICSILMIAVILPVDEWGNLPGPFASIAALATGSFVSLMGYFFVYYIRDSRETLNLSENLHRPLPEISKEHAEKIPDSIPVLPCDWSHHHHLETLYGKLDMKTKDILILAVASMPMILHDTLFPEDRYPISALFFSSLIFALGSLIATSESEVLFEASGFATIAALLCIMPASLISPYQILLGYTLPYTFFYLLSIFVQTILSPPME